MRSSLARTTLLLLLAGCAVTQQAGCAATQQQGQGPRLDSGTDAGMDAMQAMVDADLGVAIDAHTDVTVETGPSCTPSGVEVPYNGVDEDCDPATSDTDVDLDGAPGGTSGTDCDDGNNLVHPGATETFCNDVDDDCDVSTSDRDPGTFGCLTDQGAWLSFSGPQQVQVAASTEFNFAASQFTVEAWLNLSPTATNFPTIVSTRGSASTGFAFMVCALTSSCSTPGGLMFQIAGANFISPSSAPDLRDGEWHHVAVARRGGTLKYYVDGVSVGSVAGTGNISSTAPLLIGHDAVAAGVTGNMNGSIFGVRLWNVERTAAEIASARDRVVPTDETGLVAQWRMNSGLGQSVPDKSMGAHEGVLGTSTAVESVDPTWIVF